MFTVSDPIHHRYGQHLTAREVHELTRPSAVSRRLVLEWLQLNCNYTEADFSTSPAGDWLYFTATISDLETLLQAEYFIYRHEKSDEATVRTTQWSVPAHLVDHVEIIEPTTAFFRPRAQSKYGAPLPAWEQAGRIPTYDELAEEDMFERGKIEVPSIDEISAKPTIKEACNRLTISPLCLRALYGTLGYEVKAPDQVKIGIVNFLGQSTNRSDVQLFLDAYRPDAAAGGAAASFAVKLVAGATDEQGPLSAAQLERREGSEAALDAQVVLGTSWPLPLTTYNVGGRPPMRPIEAGAVNTNEPYLAWLAHVKAHDDVPSVISISYAEDEKTVPPEYARRVCAEFAQLGARGVSVLVASGDFGVGKEGHCFRRGEEGEDDGGSNSNRRPGFMPSFPASCPYVTAIGGTRFLEPEMVGFDARSGFSTGGGFSDLFSQPSYQRGAVRGYLERLGDEYAGLYNPAGRAYPDVNQLHDSKLAAPDYGRLSRNKTNACLHQISAQSYHFAVMYNGVKTMQDGTSASTPTVAAVIALVNDALAAEGRPPLGFLNPWIYSKGYRGLTDVTRGSNLGCNTTGFPAGEGWDPATGFGTPWFPKLRELAMQRRFRPGTTAAESRGDSPELRSGDSPQNVGTDGSEPDRTAESPFKRLEDVSPCNGNIVTPRAVLLGIVCGILVNAANMYLGLKTGFTFTANILGSLIGFAVFNSWGKTSGAPFGPHENNIVQTVATAAGGMSSVFVSVIPAMYQLGLLSTPSTDFLKLVSMVAAGGYFGLFSIAGPFLIDHMARPLNLVFPTSFATAITSRDTHSAAAGAHRARKQIRLTLVAFFASMGLTVVSQYAVGILWDWHIFSWLHQLGVAPSFSIHAESWGWVVEWSPAMIGTGMMIHPNVAFSFFGGSTLAWGIIGPYLVSQGVAFGRRVSTDLQWLDLKSYVSMSPDFANATHPSARYWLLWPGVACTLVVAFMELACQWRGFWACASSCISSTYRPSFKTHSYRRLDQQEQSGEKPHGENLQITARMWAIPLAIVVILACWVTKMEFGMSVVETILALLLAFVMSMVTIQATGATDTTPVSAVSKVSQVLLNGVSHASGAAVPTAQRLGLVGGGLTMLGANQATDLMADFKVGFLLQTPPRAQYAAQLLGTLVATLFVPAVFVLFTAAYPCIIIMDDDDIYNDTSDTCPFPGPGVAAWKAVTLAAASSGDSSSSAIPPSSGAFALALAVCSALIVLLKNALLPPAGRVAVPNMMALGIAFTVPSPRYGTSMLAGALAALAWRRADRNGHARYAFAVAAGLVAGEGVGGTINCVLTILGVGGQELGTTVGCPAGTC
ncbi:hypothetical protein DL764_003511 [Monosporascus ibericus]|uniref:Peptidase S53 domain-containing protein n=1 Tax=Monosporascus ibericus TaxID=155417 RepID=A0A4Q4TGY0_9PEZI|nr:hypothetical protein DL764_003511 [Monosporascus ibericus]